MKSIININIIKDPWPVPQRGTNLSAILAGVIPPIQMQCFPLCIDTVRTTPRLEPAAFETSTSRGPEAFLTASEYQIYII